MRDRLDFALNHMVAPRLDLAGFFALAKRVRVEAVEIRNDLPGSANIDSAAAASVREQAAGSDLTVLTINALQRFNHWTDDRAEEARRLIDYASGSGAAALVLCPVNDMSFAPPEGERLAMLRASLEALAPMLTEAGIIGLIEPLGFAECSLRLKREAVEAIDATGTAATFRLVHDTFHHHVASETELFADRTGLVHVSGVIDPSVGLEAMRDPHRGLVGADDRIDNAGQVRALRAAGYAGPLSFEPFADSVHASTSIEAELRDCMDHLSEALR